jgi:uncharacterized protein (TIGR03083 family)
MADKQALQRYFADSQHEFAALAGSLTSEQWATPSLCEGWTVREVVVHTAWHIHLRPSLASTRDFLQFLVLGNARFTRDHMARDGARSNESLVRWLQSPAPCSENYLCELMMHQQDVRSPLSFGPPTLAFGLDARGDGAIRRCASQLRCHRAKGKGALGTCDAHTANSALRQE